jgi:hypothetical protein
MERRNRILSRHFNPMIPGDRSRDFLAAAAASSSDGYPFALQDEPAYSHHHQHSSWTRAPRSRPMRSLFHSPIEEFFDHIPSEEFFE